ncbi:hypothetical protein VTL71DRAFT_13374 [Oculimacula yallundae]|uniref:LysM domain-containing protein n=1 Tax=Oculimacula yallundae TaxID=86028 RepID=A0ABR4CKB4_9HELO
MQRSFSTIRRLFSRVTTSKSKISSRQIETTATNVNTSTYTVKSGDTLAKIASQSGSSVSALQQANPDINTSNLKVGRVIRLPRAQPAAMQSEQARASSEKYTIQSGDTFTTIAAKIGVSVKALEDANSGVNPNNLQIGAQINVPSSLNPVPSPAPSQPAQVSISGSIYTIQAGDTFSTIAAVLGTTAAVIQAANPGVNPNTLQVGSFINVPPRSKPAPVPSPTQPSPALGNKYTIQAGDTYGSIAAKLGITVVSLQSANPGVNPNALQIGSQINIPTISSPAPIPAQPSPAPGNKYTIQAGDTYSSIAAKLGTSVEAIQAANPGVNPNSLQIGSQIIVPSTTSPSPGPVTTPPNPIPATPSSGTYIIQAGDTFTTIATKFNTSVAAIEVANPNVSPTTLQVGQIINLPSGAGSVPDSGNTGGGPAPPNTGGYVDYSGPASSFPPPSQWASYSTLWAQNSSLMSFSNTPSEIAIIGSSIPLVATSSNLDARVILCIIMQESGGNVRVGNTFNGVTNTGIMQAYNGSSFNAADPQGSILQMIRDGSEGTSNGPGFKQAFAEFGNYYEAARKYNSGSVDRNQLNNPLGATAGYVRDLANRLMGHKWAGM